MSVLWDFVGAGPHKVDSGACVLVWDGLLEKCGASRVNAVRQLHAHYAIPAKEGRKLVDAAFEGRQLRRYEEDPELALTDLVKIRFQ